MMGRVLLLAVVLAATAVPVHGYSHFGTGVGTARLHWATMPIRWFATDRSVPGVSSTEFRAAVERAFKTWTDVPTSSMQFVFGGTTALEPDQDDDLSVLGFQNHPEMDRVLAATSFDFNDDTGELIEADIFFNSFFEWSTAVGGDAARFDLESVAVHEIGHLLGLGHSAIGETELRPEGGRRVLGSGAVMFPISIGRGAIADRVLQPDDIAGISDLYPEGNFEDTTGGVRGRVRRGSAGVVGAHVVVFNLRTRSLVGGFSLGNDGDFQILGLAPGPYVVRVEPLDDADTDSFFDLDSIDIGFQVTYYPRLVVAPSGGVGDSVDVTVRPK
jgi:hypothetical protein